MVVDNRDVKTKPEQRCNALRHGTEGVSSMQDTVYLLCRVEDDESISLVGEHADLVEGIKAGKHRVEVECFDYAYRLLTDDGCKVGTFGEGRIGYREWARRRGYIRSLEDRYDKDEDELVGVGY